MGAGVAVMDTSRLTQSAFSKAIRARGDEVGGGMGNGVCAGRRVQGADGEARREREAGGAGIARWGLTLISQRG